MSAGLKFRQAVAENHPLQLMGTITAYAVRMAETGNDGRVNVGFE